MDGELVEVLLDAKVTEEEGFLVVVSLAVDIPVVDEMSEGVTVAVMEAINPLKDEEGLLIFVPVAVEVRVPDGVIGVKLMGLVAVMHGELVEVLLDVKVTKEEGTLVFVPMPVDAPVPDGVIGGAVVPATEGINPLEDEEGLLVFVTVAVDAPALDGVIGVSMMEGVELLELDTVMDGQLAEVPLGMKVTVKDGVLVFVPMAVDAPVPDGVIE